MKLDDLRNILLSERETGRLTAIPPDVFGRGHAELTAITKKVYASEDPFSDEVRALIDESQSVRQTLQDLFAIRCRKIVALTIMHAEGNYYDREEVKRMIPAEKELFDQMTASIGQCQGTLLYSVPHGKGAAPPAVPAAGAVPDLPGGSTRALQPALPAEAEEEDEGSGAPQIPENPLAHPCVLVHVREDMESFMGVDGRIYTLAKGDIVTLPERNAAVLAERNIVLNINVCK